MHDVVYDDVASVLATAFSPAAQMLSVVVMNCSHATGKWSYNDSNGRFTHDKMCLTAVLPMANNDLVLLTPCATDHESSKWTSTQKWTFNTTYFNASAPNVSGAILYPKHNDTSAVFGFTWPKPALRTPPWTAISLYDIGRRFHGECDNHHNCNFQLDAASGVIRTYTPGLCLGAVPFAPPPPPPPAPAPAVRNGTLRFARACQSGMVLQRAPEQAAVYGALGAPPAPARDALSAPPSVSVTVSSSSSSSSFASYTVPAAIVDDGVNWKALLKLTPKGGSYTITVSCASGCNVTHATASITDVTFGDVWYCGGQSNMALPVLHTFSRNLTTTAILKHGKYGNIRMSGMKGNMNPQQDWISAFDAANSTSLFSYSSICWYFAQSLADLLGKDAPPIGLIHTSYGGSTIEQWSTRATSAKCAGAEPDEVSAQSWWDQRVVPYLDTTVKGFLWYQGENNCHGVMGNSAQHIGYGCQMPMMVAEWRAAWSTTPGTTKPDAPFGIVSLASGGSEGGADIGGMRWSQTANYGVAPNPAMPNTFLAHAYDLGDPWQNTSCEQWKCCPKYGPLYSNATECALHFDSFQRGEKECAAACDGLLNTTYYLGPIHPRIKLPVGRRLALAAHGLVYGGAHAIGGPQISGCEVIHDRITVKFNTTLLTSKGRVGVKAYDAVTTNSAMRVLVDSSLWCKHTLLSPKVGPRFGSQYCTDEGAPSYGICGGSMQCGVEEDDALSFAADDAMRELGDHVDASSTSPPTPAPATWVLVDIVSKSASSITLDLSNLHGATPLALRYAWGNTRDACCRVNLNATERCVPASCPIWDEMSGLPANPFLAQIVNGKCRCVAPQVCDE